jgi:hypothetical protein
MFTILRYHPTVRRRPPTHNNHVHGWIKQKHERFSARAFFVSLHMGRIEIVCTSQMDKLDYRTRYYLGMTKKQERPVAARKLNRLHFNTYVGIGTIVLFLYLYWLVAEYSGWRLSLLFFPAVFLYGVCRFPITRGTGSKAVDAGFIDFMNLTFLWLQIGIGIALIIYFVSWMQ